MFRLGQLYELGAEGGVPNFEKAKEYYGNSANYGYGPARAKYNALKSKEPQNVNDNIYAPKCYWKDGKLVNEQGKVIMSKGQYSIQSFQGEVIIVKKGNKVGAITYNGNLVVHVAYDKYEGSGAEGRMLFSTTSGNSTTCSIFALNGRLVAKQTFSNSGSSYSVSMFIKNNMNFLKQPYR